MQVRSLALAIIALVSVWPCDRVDAAPILEDPLRGLDRTGFGIDFHANVLGIYDASLDRLRITSRLSDAEYHGPGTSLVFTSFFELTAGVDEFGNVTNGGTMRWEGDFGSGRELLATGKLIDLGFDTLGISSDVTQNPNVFSLLRLLLDIDFLDTRVQGLGSHIGFGLENQWPSLFSSPFTQDWVCPSGGGEGLRCWEPVSTSGMGGVIVNNVPEPGSLGLIGLSLGLLVTFRYRNSQRSGPAGRRRKFAGDLRERLLSLAKLFRHQLAGAAIQQLTSRFLQIAIGTGERVEVAAARRDGSRVGALESHALFQMLAEQIDASPVIADTYRRGGCDCS